MLAWSFLQQDTRPRSSEREYQLEVQEVYPEDIGHGVLLYEEGELPGRVEEQLDVVQQRLVRRVPPNGEPESVAISRSRGFLWTARQICWISSRHVCYLLLVGETLPRQPGVGNTDLPVGGVQYH